MLEKRTVLLFGLGVAIGTSLAHLKDKYPERKCETVFSLPLPLKVLDAVLEFGVMRFIGVDSHDWHWRKMRLKEEVEGFTLFLRGSSKGNPSHIPFHGLIAHLGGRREGHLLGIDWKDPRTPPNVDRYLIGYIPFGAKYVSVCGLTKQASESVMFLAGPDEGCRVLAFNKNGLPLPIKKLSELTHRSDRPKGVRVL